MTTESRPHPPSARRLRQAREQGQVPRSAELSASASLLAALAVALTTAPWAARRLAELSLACERAFEAMSLPMARALVHQAFEIVFQLSAGPLLAAAVAHIAVTWAQTGVVVSLEPVQPRLSRLNPTEGWTRLFSIRSAATGLSMAVKTAVVGAAAGAVAWDLLGDSVRVIHLDANGALAVAEAAIVRLAVACGALFVFIGLVDAGYQVWQHRRDLRMSHSEVRREQRDDHGDAHVRSQRKELATEPTTAEQLAWVRWSTAVFQDRHGRVVVVAHRPERFSTPLTVLRARGDFATQVLRVAGEHGLAIVHDDAIVARLFPGARPGDPVPPSAADDVLRHVSGR